MLLSNALSPNQRTKIDPLDERLDANGVKALSWQQDEVNQIAQRIDQSELLRKIAPRAACSRDPQHSVNEQPVIAALRIAQGPTTTLDMALQTLPPGFWLPLEHRIDCGDRRYAFAARSTRTLDAHLLLKMIILGKGQFGFVRGAIVVECQQCGTERSGNLRVIR